MIRRTIVFTLLGAMLVSVTGCVGTIGASTLTPKVTPPAIAHAGILRAAIDMNLPPFGGTVKGENVGLDVDVAAAVAEQLGLKLEVVNAAPPAAAALLASGTVDIVLGGLTVDSAVAAQIAFAGTYVADAPGVFASQGASVSVEAIGTKRIAVQKESLAYWLLLDTYGEAPLVVVPSLDEAFKAVVSKKADVVAGDALVGSYMLRTYPAFAYQGQIGSAFPLGIGVAQADPKLETQVRSALDKLAAQGVLETLRRKWVGDVPPLKVVETPASQEASASLAATPAP